MHRPTAAPAATNDGRCRFPDAVVRILLGPHILDQDTPLQRHRKIAMLAAATYYSLLAIVDAVSARGQDVPYVLLLLYGVPSLAGAVYARFSGSTYGCHTLTALLVAYLLVDGLAAIRLNRDADFVLRGVAAIFGLSLLEMPPWAFLFQVCLFAVLHVVIAVERVCNLGMAASVGRWNLAFGRGSTSDAELFHRLLTWVVAPVALALAVYHGVHRSKTRLSRVEHRASALDKYVERLVRYDTEGAAEVLEDHEEWISADSLRTLHQLIQNLERYRPFVPPLLLQAAPTAQDEVPNPLIATELPDVVHCFIPVRSPQGLSPSAFLDNAVELEVASVGSEPDLRRVGRGMPPLTVDVKHLPNGEELEDVTPTQHHPPLLFVRSFAAVALVHFEEIAKSTTSSARDNPSSHLPAGVATLLRLCCEYGCTLQGSRGSTAMVTWGVGGSVAPKQLHRTLCSFALALRAAFSSGPAPVTPAQWIGAASSGCQVSCALHVGDLYTATAGTNLARSTCVFGPFPPREVKPRGLTCLPWSQAAVSELELLLEAAKWHNAILVTPSVAQQVGWAVHCRAIDVVRLSNDADCRPTGFPNNRQSPHSPSTQRGRHLLQGAGFAKTTPRGRPHLPQPQPIAAPVPVSGLRCYEVVAPFAVPTSPYGGASEWMYSLQQAQAPTSSFGVCEVMNRAVEQYSLGHHEEAANTLNALSNQQRQDPRLVTLEMLTSAFKASRGDTAPYAREFGWAAF